MNDSYIIKAEHINKSFILLTHPIKTFMEILFKKKVTRRQVLHDISFELRKGETLGILGLNGAGKSTLLKIITGIIYPDSGIIEKKGDITALLELGTGFDENLSGRQNIYINATLLGISPQKIKEKEEKIIQFSELGKRIDDPIKTYSSGMKMRLAFSIAIFADPQCLIVDEALAVGDISFQQKCFKAIESFIINGGSLIFVSHDLSLVKKICEKSIVLDQGKVLFYGKTSDAIVAYQRHLSGFSVDHKKQFFGEQNVFIEEIYIKKNNEIINKVICNEKVEFFMKIGAREDFDNLAIGIMILDKFGQTIYGTNTKLLNKKIHFLKNHKYIVKFLLTLSLGPGKYTLTVGIHNKENFLKDVQFWYENIIEFEVLPEINPDFVGLVKLPLENIVVEEVE